MASGGHEVVPLLSVRARPADAVLLADGRVGGLVRQDGLEAGEATASARSSARFQPSDGSDLIRLVVPLGCEGFEATPLRTRFFCHSRGASRHARGWRPQEGARCCPAPAHVRTDGRDTESQANGSRQEDVCRPVGTARGSPAGVLCGVGGGGGQGGGGGRGSEGARSPSTWP